MLLCFLSLFMAAAGASANERIYVNREVTTHIVMPENIKMVDISTTKIAGNQCTDNIVRIKPSCGSDSIPEAGYRDNELLGTLTLIGERHIAQYDILYTQSPQMAASIFEVPYSHTQSYINPEVTMPMAEMARYAWAVYGSGRKYNQIVSRAHGMKAVVNNIYAVGDYFFIDYSLQNKTKIAYDIEELRVKLTDKKETKATNSQTIELSPVFSLNHVRKFKKSYRNVLVLPKLTFPDEKVLRLEISENQISGRVITLTIEYEDILHADGFDSDILKTRPTIPIITSLIPHSHEKLIFALLCAVVTIGASAQDGKLTVNAGFLFPSTLNATVGYEHPLAYGNALEVFGEVGNHWRKPDFGKVTIGTAASCTSTALPVTRTECCAFASGRSSGRWKGSSSSDWREALNTVMCSVTDGSSPLPKRTM